MRYVATHRPLADMANRFFAHTGTSWSYVDIKPFDHDSSASRSGSARGFEKSVARLLPRQAAVALLKDIWSVSARSHYACSTNVSPTRTPARCELQFHFRNTLFHGTLLRLSSRMTKHPPAQRMLTAKD